jgi:acetamidase/formamidase
MTLGFGPTLDEAAAMATSGMLDLMESQLALTRTECLALASSRVSLRVTQLVNPAKGVHAVLD